jgi:hypothetical protein
MLVLKYGGLSIRAIRNIIKPAMPGELLMQFREAFTEHANSTRDCTIQPVPDDLAFDLAYNLQPGENC